MSDENERGDHREALEAWSSPKESEIIESSFEVRRNIEMALYAFSEQGLMLDGRSVTVGQALMIWAVVETARQSGFPEELRM